MWQTELTCSALASWRILWKVLCFSKLLPLQFTTAETTDNTSWYSITLLQKPAWLRYLYSDAFYSAWWYFKERSRYGTYLSINGEEYLVLLASTCRGNFSIPAVHLITLPEIFLQFCYRAKNKCPPGVLQFQSRHKRPAKKPGPALLSLTSTLAARDQRNVWILLKNNAADYPRRIRQTDRQTYVLTCRFASAVVSRADAV